MHSASMVSFTRRLLASSRLLMAKVWSSPWRNVQVRLHHCNNLMPNLHEIYDNRQTFFFPKMTFAWDRFSIGSFTESLNSLNRKFLRACILILYIVCYLSLSFSIMVILFAFLGQRKPATLYEKITINKNSRATLSSVRNIIRKNKYRKDLRMVR